jgi:hypothetical protein
MFDYNFDETFWNEYDEDEELYWNNATIRSGARKTMTTTNGIESR